MTMRVFKPRKALLAVQPPPPMSSRLSILPGCDGWYLNEELTGDSVGNSYTIGTANQQLWPKIETGNYLYFISGEGATYTEPQFVAPLAGTQVPMSQHARLYLSALVNN